MKRLLSVLILALLVNIGIAQENTVWVDSILTKIILHEIEVVDDNFKPIKNASIKLLSRDTVINCQWSRPKYLNNILQGSFDGILIESQIVFDTSTNKKNTAYIDFKYSQYDVNGNFLKDTVAFSIHKKEAKLRTQNLDSRQINSLKNTAWINNQIVIKETKIELDSCHKTFKLTFNDDFTFTQQYGNKQRNCFTEIMKKEVGVEEVGEDFIRYHDKIKGHYLNLTKGIWKINQNNLLLIDLDEKRVLSFKIEKLTKNKLHLNFDNSNHLIKMKKVSS